MAGVLTIKRATLDELKDAPERDALIAGYAAECAMRGLPTPQPSLAMYEQLASMGLMHVILAYVGDTLIGFTLPLVSVNPHYGVGLAVLESFFVHPDHRSTGAGLRMLREAEEVAIEQGALGLFVSAPNLGTLHRVLSGLKDFSQSNAVYFKALA